MISFSAGRWLLTEPIHLEAGNKVRAAAFKEAGPLGQPRHLNLSGFAKFAAKAGRLGAPLNHAHHNYLIGMGTLGP